MGTDRKILMVLSQRRVGSAPQLNGVLLSRLQMEAWLAIKRLRLIKMAMGREISLLAGGFAYLLGQVFFLSNNSFPGRTFGIASDIFSDARRFRWRWTAADIASYRRGEGVVLLLGCESSDNA
jgi:hypothetical protein